MDGDIVVYLLYVVLVCEVGVVYSEWIVVFLFMFDEGFKRNYDWRKCFIFIILFECVINYCGDVFLCEMFF